MDAFTDLPLPLQASLYGFASACSMIIGAFLGMYTRPTEQLVALLMAFGAGCLIYAISVKLYGEQGVLLRESPTEEWLSFRYQNMWITFIMSILGACLYLGLNEMLVKLMQQQEQALPDALALNKVGPSTLALPSRLRTRSSASIHVLRSGLMRGITGDMSQVSSGLFFPKGCSRAHSHVTQRSHTGQSHSNMGQSHTDRAFGGMLDVPSMLDAAGTVDSMMSPAAAAASQSHATAAPSHKLSLEDILSEGVKSFELDEKDADGTHAQQVAFSMWLGLLLDGIPESLLIGFMTNSGNITVIFVIAIFVANFPEAYSAAAILTAQGAASKCKIFSMWAVVFLMTGTLAALGSFIMPKDVHDNIVAERLEERGGAILEGITGGSMLAMIATAMLPEAFHMAGPSAGLLFASGFVSSHLLAASGSYLGWDGPPCEHAVPLLVAAAQSTLFV